MADKIYLYLCDFCGHRFESLIKPYGKVRCDYCGTLPCKLIPEDEE